MQNEPSIELLARWRDQADQQAAAEVFHRYVARLIGLARSRLSPRLAARVDAEDVVQSACRTFFLRVRDGRLLFEPDTELWNLLAAITMNKVFGQLEYNQAGKRAVGREQTPNPQESICQVAIEALAEEPSVEAVAILTEEKQAALQGLSDLHRTMIELRLQGHSTQDIATHTNRTERLVRMVLAEFGKRLEARLGPVRGERT